MQIFLKIFSHLRIFYSNLRSYGNPLRQRSHFISKQAKKRNERLGMREDGEAEVGIVGGEPDAAGEAFVRLMPVAEIVVRKGEGHLARLAGRDENLLETLQFAKRSNQVSGKLADIELRGLVGIIGAGVRDSTGKGIAYPLPLPKGKGIYSRRTVFKGRVAQSETEGE